MISEGVDESRETYEPPPSSLKRTLQRFRDDIHRFQSESSGIRADIARLRAERDELRKIALKSLVDTKDFALHNLQQVSTVAAQSLSQQRAENNRMQQEVHSLRGDRNALKALVLQEQQRLEELQGQLKLLFQ